MTSEERENLEQARVWHLKMAEENAKRLAEDEEATQIKALENIMTIGDSVIKGGPFTQVNFQAVKDNIYDALKAWQPTYLGTRTKADEDLRTFYPVETMSSSEIVRAANALYWAVKEVRWEQDFAVAQEVWSGANPGPEATVNAPATTVDSGGTTVANVPGKAAGDRRSGERRQGSDIDCPYLRRNPTSERRGMRGDRRVNPHRRQSAHGSYPALWPMPENWPHRRRTRNDRRRYDYSARRPMGITE